VLEIGDDGTMVRQNLGNYSTNTASCPTRSGSAAKSL